MPREQRKTNYKYYKINKNRINNPGLYRVKETNLNLIKIFAR